MIVSKNALQVSKLVKIDKSNKILNNVFIGEDGTIVGANRDAVACVEPVNKTLRGKLVLEDTESEDLYLSQESVESIIRLVPRDTKHGGLLEYVNIVKKEHIADVEVYDGKRRHNLKCKVNPDNYFEYKELFKRINKEKEKIRCVVNRKRLLSVLSALDYICPDGSNFSPIWMEFTKDNDVLLKVLNPKSKQRVVCAIRGAKGAQDVWLDKNDWEKDISVVERETITKSKEVDEQIYKRVTNEKNDRKGGAMFVRQRRSGTKQETGAKKTKGDETKLFVRERRKKSRVVKNAYGKQWSMIQEKCKICGNHLRTSELGEKTCSYVKCEVYNVLIK